LRIFHSLYWSAKKKKIRSSSRNPAYKGTRSRMERGNQKKTVADAVGAVDLLPRAGAGVAGLPLPHGNVKQKRIRLPSRKPVFLLVRDRREKRALKKKVKKAIEFVDRRLVGAGVEDPAVDRELEGRRAHQEAGREAHRKLKRVWKREINRVALSHPRKTSPRIPQIQLHLYPR
jgi:hypothetical protein